MKCTTINSCLATEPFSVEYCEIETNVINLANHIRGSQSSEPIRFRGRPVRETAWGKVAFGLRFY